MSLDVARVHAAFPALDHRLAHFDGPRGSQAPQPVADAIARTLTAGISNRGTTPASEQRADAGGVIFGRTMTELTYVAGRAAQEVYEKIATPGVNAPAGSYDALDPPRWIGLGAIGAVRAGLAPYTNQNDGDPLVAGVAEDCA